MQADDMLPIKKNILHSVLTLTPNANPVSKLIRNLTSHEERRHEYNFTAEL